MYVRQTTESDNHIAVPKKLTSPGTAVAATTQSVLVHRPLTPKREHASKQECHAIPVRDQGKTTRGGHRWHNVTVTLEQSNRHPAQTLIGLWTPEVQGW